VLAVLAVLFIACAVYVNDYYHVDGKALMELPENYSVFFEILDDGSIVFTPEDPVAGFIFYPGGKVEYTAYFPLVAACAERGIFCVLVKMPYNLAVLDVNAADRFTEKYPEVENWYIGGHSLGGSMAASHLAKNVDKYSGLVLLGSYSTADLSQTDLGVLSVYGSEDKVLNAEKYQKYRQNLPDGYTEVVIQGGCHANFGAYGPQKGDGTPTVSREEQQLITADAILALVTAK